MTSNQEESVVVKICRILGQLGLILALPAIVAIFTYGWMQETFFLPSNKSKTALELVEIPSGSNFKQICANLEVRKIVKHGWALDVIARLRGQDTKINAGEYELSPAMTPSEVLAKLASGDVYKRKLVLKEGYSIWELGALVEQAGLATEIEFNKDLTNKELLTKSGIGVETFEGYLFPETYHFSRPILPKTIIWQLLEEGEKRWKPEYGIRLKQLNMSRHELLTLASIIEKESGNPEEQPIVSSVFHNRLKNGMRLESDPTVMYGIPHFSGLLTRRDLDTPTVYNTYTNFGLPPGPICNPGQTAIKAALYPSDTQYLFFVADGKGGHVFSTTLQEHNKAVADYRAFQRSIFEGKDVPNPPPAPKVVPAPAAR